MTAQTSIQIYSFRSQNITIDLNKIYKLTSLLNWVKPIQKLDNVRTCKKIDQKGGFKSNFKLKCPMTKRTQSLKRDWDGT